MARTKSLLSLAFIASAGLCILASAALGQSTFYQGKTLRFIVGGSAGGGVGQDTRAPSAGG